MPLPIDPDFLKAQMAAHHSMELGDFIMRKNSHKVKTNSAEHDQLSQERSQKSQSQQAVSSEGKRASSRKAGSADSQVSAEQRYIAAMNAPRAQQTATVPEWMWAGSQASPRPRSPKSAWQGGFSESILAARRPPKVFEAPAVQQWQLRGSSFYSYLRKENPKQYSGKGKHSSYGGNVVCHPAEDSDAVHVDRERDEQRKALEPGGVGGKFSGGESMADCMLRLRERDGERKGRGMQGLQSEGDYLRQMNLHGMFFASSDRLGHQAPGHALGAHGRWFKPAAPCKDSRGNEGMDMWGRPRRRESGKAQSQRWRWHAENV